MSRERAVRLVPSAGHEVERRLGAFIGHHVADLYSMALAPPEELARFSRAMLLADCDDDAMPRHSHFFDIVDDASGRIVGYVWTSGNNFGFGTTLYLKHLFVDPPHRRQGYAAAALHVLARQARECAQISGLALAVTPANRAAVALYRQLGFADFSHLMFLRTLPPGATET
jgi:ribosomal protein S18 acetylase RimI-like enzyme